MTSRFISARAANLLGGVAILSSVAACGASVPMELVGARREVNRVSAGPTALRNPAGLYTAKQTLAAAEHYYDEEGDTQETRDLAYTAARRAQTAELKGQAAAWQAEADQANKVRQEREAARLTQTTEELASTKSRLEQQEQQLAEERARRAEAEQRAAEAAEALAKVATVKQESRGMVITLSGNVLFETNKSRLFPGAQQRLDEVARALSQQSPDAQIIVEGHADAQGDDEHNLILSQARAEAVRDYLISRGLDANRIVAKGYGESRPIADNGSPEGRANNRRVEIVVANAPQSNSNQANPSSNSPESSSGQSKSAPLQSGSNNHTPASPSVSSPQSSGVK
jgi:outer membrane protein OmpA-like peptidoglycan-associated protein